MPDSTPAQADAATPRNFPARIGFAGTPEFAATVLHALLEAGANVVCVYTQPDRPSGRGRKLVPSAVKTLAQDHGIDVHQPKSLRNDEAREQLQSCELDVLVVAAYGLILPQPILDAPALGCINVHASLLPRWRGAAPIERAIMAGDTESGVCIMRMEAGLDTGGVYCARRLPVTDTTTGRELHDALAELGGAALLDTLDGFNPDTCIEQDDTLATYANKLSAEDAVINWDTSSTLVARHINALNDRLPARTTVQNTGETLFMLQASVAAQTAVDNAGASGAPGTLIAHSKKAILVATADGAVSIREVQLRRGKGRPMPVAAALNGYSELFAIGQRFTSSASPATSQ